MADADGPVRRVIDGCAFHDWATNAELVPYLGGGWGELVELENLAIKGMWHNIHPLGNKDPAAQPPDGGSHASDPDFLIQQLFDERGCERVVLGHREGLLSSALPLAYEARAVVRALNDWTVDQWLDRDERLYGHILVASAIPDEAAAEIRRVGEHKQFVAVALGANGLNKPFGHPVYHPIYQAAAELALPVVVQVDADNIVDPGTSPTAVGLSMTYAEFDAMSAAPLVGHVSSFFTCGVFDLYPQLRLLLVGGGLAWIPEYIWRLDWNFKMVRRVDAPWARRMPSEYLAEHVRFTTYTMETRPTAEQFQTLLELIPRIDETLLYASGYPYADGDDAAEITARMPESMHDRVLHENAEAFYRFPDVESVPASDMIGPEETTRGKVF